MSALCHRCSTALNPTLGATPTVGMRDSCIKCGVDLHVCKMCEFYDPGAHHECRESSAEYVRDKERGNRCDYFRLIRKSSAKPAASSATDAAAAFEALFKK